MSRLLTRRGLLRTAGLAAPALLMPQALAQFGACLPGFCRSTVGCINNPGTPLEGLSGVTGAWSASRKMYSSYVGPFYTLSGGNAVDILYDQSGASRDFSYQSTGTRPTVVCAPTLTGLLYNGSTDWLSTGQALSNFITATDGYMIASFIATGFSTNNTAPTQPYNNAPVILDLQQNAGIVTTDNSGSPLIYSINWGSNNYAQQSILANVPYVAEWRHQAGVLYSRLNGDQLGETFQASGNTTLTGPLILGGRLLTPGHTGYIYEAAIFSTIPVLAVRDALVHNLGTYIGAVVP